VAIIVRNASLPSPHEPPRYPPFNEKNYQVAVAQLARYDELIAKEYTLVADRMNWLLLSESFIFTVFIGSAAYYEQAGPTIWLLLQSIIIIMPLLGIFIAVVIIRAIGAADEASCRLKQGREAFEKRLPDELRIDQIAHDDLLHHRGNTAPWWTPRALIGIWILLLVLAIHRLYRFGI
jgi:hypothetical protein